MKSPNLRIGLGRQVCQYIDTGVSKDFSVSFFSIFQEFTLLRRVDWLAPAFDYVSKEWSASIFKVKNSEALQLL